MLARNESGEPIQVMELLELGHTRIATDFLLEEKSNYAEQTWESGVRTAESYPLKSAKSHVNIAAGPRLTPWAGGVTGS